ncbi:hypothetical protein ACLFMI_01815 [Pseudonocardia nantongensis]|uniref:hypothetical protein n=1 Tax=Pseudonocardia nantongensis TaxID=1181885 RepID=UPI003978288C
MTTPGRTLLAVHLDRSNILRPVLPSLRAGLAHLLEGQADGPDDLQVVLSTGNDLTRTLSDGSHPVPVPATATEARAALPARLRPLAGPDLPNAAGRLLDAVGDELASRDAADRPDRVVVLLVGEGGVGTADALRERIEHQRATYAWEFVLVDVSAGPVPAPGWGPKQPVRAGTGDGAGKGAVAVAERPERPDPAARFGIPAGAVLTSGPGADGVTAGLEAASGFVRRARGTAAWEPVEGFSGDERAAADVPDTRPAWRRLLRLS